MATVVLQGVIDQLLKFNHDVPMEFPRFLSEPSELRRLRIAERQGLVEEDDPIQNPARWLSYKLTPKGMAVLDLHLLKKR